MHSTAVAGAPGAIVEIASANVLAAKRLALGTVQFGLAYGIANQGGQVSPSEVRAMLQLARSKGIGTLDTAVSYGESEAILGSVGVSEFDIVTKLPSVPAECLDIGRWVDKQVSISLSRLGASVVDGLLLHRPQQLLGVDGSAIYEALQTQKRAGRVRKIGVSIYGQRDLEPIVQKFAIDIVQGPLNLIDRRLQVSGWLRQLKQASVEVHVRSCFLQGLLLMPREEIPRHFGRWDPLWAEWHAWLDMRRQTALQTCLAFPLSLPEVDRVVVGADSVTQLDQIIMAASLPPSSEFPDLENVDEELINPATWPKK